MPRRFATHILFAFVAVSLALPAPRAFAQAPSRAAIASEDLSTSLQSVTRQVEPAVVEIFTTSYAPGEGVVPRTADLVTTSARRAQASSSIRTATSSPTHTSSGVRSACAWSCTAGCGALDSWRAAEPSAASGRRPRSRNRSGGRQSGCPRPAGTGLGGLRRLAAGQVVARIRQSAWSAQLSVAGSDQCRGHASSNPNHR